MTTTPNLGLTLPAMGDGIPNGKPWGTSLNGNFSILDGATMKADLASTASAALGDALVGVKKTGGIATTQHTVNASRVFDVVADFGADPTGVKDSSDAIQAGLDAFGASRGGTLFFPRGIYSVSKTLTASAKNIALIGEKSGQSYASTLPGATQGAKGVRIVWTANPVSGIGLDLVPGGAITFYTEISDIAFSGGGLLTTGARVGGQQTFRNCTFEYCTNGMDLTVSINQLSCEYCEFIYNSAYGVKMAGGSTVDNTVSQFQSCRFASCGTTTSGAGVLIQNARQPLFQNCTFESNLSYDLLLEQNYIVGWGAYVIGGVTLQQCWFERSANTASGEYLYMIYSTCTSAAIAVGMTGPSHTHILDCNFSGGPAISGTRYIKLNYSDAATIENCVFYGGDQANGIQLTSNAKNTKIINRLQDPTAPQKPITAGAGTVEECRTFPDWLTGTTYAAGNKVKYSGSTYRCILGLTSAVAPPSDASHWVAGDSVAVSAYGTYSFENAADGLPIKLQGVTPGVKFTDLTSQESNYLYKNSASGVGLGVLNNAQAATLTVYDSGRLGLPIANTIAASGTSGVTGQICWDASYLYVCTATGWRRVSLGAAF